MLKITDIKEEPNTPDTIVLFRKVRKKEDVIKVPISTIKELQTQQYFLKRCANRECNPERKREAEMAAEVYEYILSKLGCDNNIDESRFTECNWVFSR